MKYLPIVIFFLLIFLLITGCKLHPTGRVVYQECQNIPYEVQEEYTVDELYSEKKCDTCEETIKHKPVTKFRTVTKYKTKCK